MIKKTAVITFVLILSFNANSQSLADMYKEQKRREAYIQETDPKTKLIQTLKNEGRRLICSINSGGSRSGSMADEIDFDNSMKNLIIHNGNIYQYSQIDPRFNKTGPVVQGKYVVKSNVFEAEVKYGRNNLIALEVNLSTREAFMAKDGEITKLTCTI